MESRKHSCAVFIALASLFAFQSAGLAKAGFSGGIKFTGGSKHFKITQPTPPVQAPPTVNVRAYGAMGDGTTDDTAAIQNAIAAAKASGEKVLFPAGTYLHTNVLTANGVGLVGVGGASVLLANNPAASAVILSGMSPSIQNLVINSAPAGSGSFAQGTNTTTLAVVAAQNFVVQGITVLQGQSRPGAYLQQSSIGQVTSVSFNGSGLGNDIGIVVDGCANTSLMGNSIMNESTGIRMGAGTFISYSIAAIGNSISASTLGIQTSNTSSMYLAQNSIQVSGTTTAQAIGIAPTCTGYTVTGNVTSGGLQAIQVIAGATSSGVISQNIFRNCAGSGAVLNVTAAGGSVQFISNQFGECGLTTVAPVINASTTGGPDAIVVFSNLYQGHVNNLNYYILSGQHLDFVAGNTQTQTTLGNLIP
jgi:polygalacturonase